MTAVRCMAIICISSGDLAVNRLLSSGVSVRVFHRLVRLQHRRRHRLKKKEKNGARLMHLNSWQLSSSPFLPSFLPSFFRSFFLSVVFFFFYIFFLSFSFETYVWLNPSPTTPVTDPPTTRHKLIDYYLHSWRSLRLAQTLQASDLIKS